MRPERKRPTKGRQARPRLSVGRRRATSGSARFSGTSASPQTHGQGSEGSEGFDIKNAREITVPDAGRVVPAREASGKPDGIRQTFSARKHRSRYIVPILKGEAPSTTWPSAPPSAFPSESIAKENAALLALKQTQGVCLWSGNCRALPEHVARHGCGSKNNLSRREIPRKQMQLRRRRVDGVEELFPQTRPFTRQRSHSDRRSDDGPRPRVEGRGR